MLTIETATELSSDLVELIPLTLEHADEFYAAGHDPSLWRWVSPYHCRDLTSARAWVKQSLDKIASKEHIAFVIVDRASGQLVGSTRFCAIDHENKGIEIGFTFITPKFQRGHVNSHAKFLMLRQAFESFGAIRVQFKTHHLNQKSRNAIARLGASFEGVIRNQRILADGSRRDTAQFSITDDDWPLVKQRLLAKIDGQHAPDTEKFCLSGIAQQLIEHAPLAQLSISGSDKQLEQTIYLPLWFDAQRQVLMGHLSRHNKLNWLLESNPTVNVIFHGQDAYISPTWHEEQVVPTWNYQRLHLEGYFSFVADDDNKRKLALLSEQISALDAEQWQLSQQSPHLLCKMVEHIRCFEITLSQQTVVEKVSDKKSQPARDAIAKQLQVQGLDHLAQRHQS